MALLTQTHTHTHTNTYTQTHTHTNTYTQTHTHKQIRTQAHTHARARTYTGANPTDRQHAVQRRIHANLLYASTRKVAVNEILQRCNLAGSYTRNAEVGSYH